MNDKTRLEQRLKEFYDRVPDVEDALPFKDYLLKHEDSRMAWYLLGKQYTAKGQDAKAAYCYSQAGEIYEAFENKAAPQLPETVVPKQPAKGKRSRMAVISAAGLLAAGLLFYAGKASAPDPETAPHDPGRGAVSEPAATGPASPVAATASSGGKAVYTAIAGAAEPDEAGAAQLAAVTAKAGEQSMLLVRSPKLGRWTDWIRSGKPVAGAAAGNAPGAVSLQWHDAKWCECTADGGQAASQYVADWKPAQEKKLALRSAVVQYRNRTGKWPERSEDLAGAYPDNMMAGWSDELTPWFEELTSVQGNKKDGKIPQTAGWPQGQAAEPGFAVPAGELEPMTQMPLEIIVDKANHRLAVVSGNVLLRNYAVGLGGERTPEGKFVISEKVRNPNGRSDGEFGSRGMTLSDTLYAIHGTNEPDSIGKDESLGCIRMAKEDLEELYDWVPAGTAVTITKGVLPSEIRVPEQRFELPAVQDETNPRKVYEWLN